ncbi:uncharacterized protein [Coffea arabica]|uniref:RNase H type-1 domain-containing protein n=1 Tax=Coffea arabica TaxID=13443 RepID=A0ABM4VQQ9_COFAR
MYLLQVLQPPKAIFAKLGRICNAFLWNKSREARGIHWVAWEKLCYPVEEEGIGLRSFKDMCSVFACKLLWRLQQRESIWAQFMHAKYIRGRHPSLVQVPRPPWSWRRLEQVRERAEQQIHWCIGKGFIDFWYDRWLVDSPLADVVSMVDSPHMLVTEYFGDDGWKLDRLREWVPDWVIALFHEAHIYPEQEDRMMMLKRVGIPIVSRCLYYGRHEESWRHLFITGTIAVQPGGKVRHIQTVAPLIVLWCLWKARNNARFEGMRFDASGVIKMVDQMIGQLGTTGVLSATHFRGDAEDPLAQLAARPNRQQYCVAVSWKRPPPLFFKLNTDASVSQGRAAGDGILRDSSGRVVFAFYKEFGDTEVLTAESLALLQGLQLCQEQHVQGLLVHYYKNVVL